MLDKVCPISRYGHITYEKGGKIMANILVVDDAAFMRMSIRKMLESNGHTVVGEAGTGIDGVLKYQELHPDVALFDLTMPEMDGMSAIKKIKEIDSKARIIVCTALGQQSKIAEAIESGATDFIVKPFEVARLLAAVEKVMKLG